MNNNLVKAAKEILHLHLCEQEGISSGQPTREQWLTAVDNLSAALSSHTEQGEEVKRSFGEILEGDYHVQLEPNRRDESICLAAEKYASQFKSGEQGDGWIKIENGNHLPEDEIYVLVNIVEANKPYGIEVAWRENNEWRMYCSDGEANAESDADMIWITHWRPLPAPPSQTSKQKR